MDLKRPPKLRDADALRRYHLSTPYCEVGEPGCIGATKRSIHHILSRGQGGDDVDPNFLMLCGSGTTGLHGRVTENDPAALAQVYAHILMHRPDVLVYLEERLEHEAALDWLARIYG